MAFCANCGRELSDVAPACPSCGHPGPGARAVGTAFSAGDGRPYAGWWQRVAAALIDGLVIGIPSWILMLILGVGVAASSKVDFETGTVSNGGFLGGFIAAWLIIAGLGILYRVLLEGSDRGQTIGKMAMKIQVRDAVAGGPIGYGRAFLRWLIASILWIALYIPGLVDVLFPLWDARHQTLHDKVAKSVVVQAV